MRPIPADSLGHAHGLLRAIDKRGRLRTDEFVTEFSLDELFPPDLENALGRMRHFISYARAAGLVKEDRGVVELTEVGRRYIRSGEADTPFAVGPQQAEWLRRQLREKHMTDSIFHGLAIGLSLLASTPPGTRVGTTDFGRSMAYLGRAGWDNENTLQIQGERHLILLQDMEMITAQHTLTPTGEMVRGELTLPVHMSLPDIAAQLNPGGAEAVRAAAAEEYAEPLPPEPVVSEPEPEAPEPEEEEEEDDEDAGYHTVVGSFGSVTPDDAEPEAPRPPIVPRAASQTYPDDAPPAMSSGDPLAAEPPVVYPPPIEPTDTPTVVSPGASTPPPAVAPPAESPAPPAVAPPAVAPPAVAPPAEAPAPAVAAPPADSSSAPEQPASLAESSVPPPAVAPPAESPAPAAAAVPADSSSAPAAAESSAPPPVAVPPMESPAPPAAESPAAPVAAAPPVESSVSPPAVTPPAESSAPPVAAPPATGPEAAPAAQSVAPPAAVPSAAPAAGAAPPVVPERAASVVFVEAWAIRAAAEAAGLRLPDSVYANVAAALNAGKHLVLTGAPGSGKTSLALAVTRAAAQAGHAKGATVVTGAPAQPLITEAAARGRWVIADELDQADADATLKPLSTLLGGVPVTLNGDEAEPAAGWRIVATWNGSPPRGASVLRRFAAIDVTRPPANELKALLHQDDAQATEAVETLLALGVPVGAGVLIEAANHIRARQAAVPTDAATLADEAIAAYISPLIEL